MCIARADVAVFGGPVPYEFLCGNSSLLCKHEASLPSTQETAQQLSKQVARTHTSPPSALHGGHPSGRLISSERSNYRPW